MKAANGRKVFYTLTVGNCVALFWKWVLFSFCQIPLIKLWNTLYLSFICIHILMFYSTESFHVESFYTYLPSARTTEHNLTSMQWHLINNAKRNRKQWIILRVIKIYQKNFVTNYCFPLSPPQPAIWNKM